MNNAKIDELAKVLWNYCKMGQRLEPAEAIIAMGSMDLRVAERAAELWHQRLAPVVVASGGFGRLTGARRTTTEARKFADVLLANGVPAANILIEDKSTNSAENFTYSLALLQPNLINPKRLIAVTKPYMERRAYATAKKLFPELDIRLASPEIAYEDYPTAEITKELMLNIMVGDTQRVKLYPAKGFTIPQEMPTEVERAMDMLIELGYDQQLAQ